MSKRQRPSYLVDESSNSGGETDKSRVGEPSLKKADMPSTIRLSQKVKLEGLDGGSCLITGETDGKCIEVCHILRHKELLKRHQKCFGMKEEIHIDSVENLIHLRADWHQTFNAGCWALVPTMKDLNDIILRLEKGKKWQFPHLDAEERCYQFITFPSLGQKPIYRATETENEYKRITYDRMPLLRSHIHPYYVIANALPKFQRAVLTPPQRQLYEKLAQIDQMWQIPTKGQTASGSGTSHRGGGGGDEDDSSKHDDGDKDNHGGRAGGNRVGKAGDKIGSKTRRDSDKIIDETVGKNGSQVQGADAGDK